MSAVRFGEGAVAERGVEAAGVVPALTLRTPTLDDVFLELTGTHIQPSDEVMEAELAEMTESEGETAEVKP